MNPRRRPTRPLAALALLLAAALCANALAQPEKPLDQQGYLGISVRDIPGGHTVVSWVFPGPLQGIGIAPGPNDIGRPDLIVALDGQPVNAEEFGQAIRARAPGDTITIDYRRSNARGGTIPDELDHEDEILSITATLDSRDEWTGTINRPRGHAAKVKLGSDRLLDPWSTDTVIGAAIAKHELTEPLKKLTDLLGEW